MLCQVAPARMSGAPCQRSEARGLTRRREAQTAQRVQKFETRVHPLEHDRSVDCPDGKEVVRPGIRRQHVLLQSFENLRWSLEFVGKRH